MDGIAGVYSLNDSHLVKKLFLALGACQHRGKSSSGIAVGNNKGIYLHKDLGLIGNVIGQELIYTYQNLYPVAAIGNVGYTKNKYPAQVNAEPIRINPRKHSIFELVVTMDGYLVKHDDLVKELREDYNFETKNKTEIIGALLHKYITESNGVEFEAGKRLIDKLHGRATFSLLALVYDKKQTYLVAINDDRAFEPFCFGKIDDIFIASSESCSHRRLGGYLEREYVGAEMTICSENGIETKRLREEKMLRDIFQGVYFGHPNSVFSGKNIFKLRTELGHALVNYYGTPKIDIIIANPDSGKGVTEGIAEALGMRVVPALIKQAQAIRTFQEEEIRQRTIEVGLKFAALDFLLKNKRIIMGDDSIVKGSVGEGGSIWSLFNVPIDYLGFWISYAPMIFPSYKEWHRGIDSLNELAVRRAFRNDNVYLKSREDINQAVAKILVDKLNKASEISLPKKVNYDQLEVKYNSLEDIIKVTGPGSFQALDASYPISEEFWPDWLKKEVEKYHKCK